MIRNPDRLGNHPDYIGMTAGDLIEILADYPENARIRIVQYYGIWYWLVRISWWMDAHSGRKAHNRALPTRPMETVFGDSEEVTIG